MFHDNVTVCAVWLGFSVMVCCATVMFPPVPLLTSIVTVKFAGMLPVLVNDTIMLTDWPAVAETVDRLAAPSWTPDGIDRVTVSVIMTEWLNVPPEPVTLMP